MTSPKLDDRTRADLVRGAVDELAPLYTPHWTGVSDPGDPGRRLIELFARLGEVLIERLNRVPERNFLSFLELTGVERFPGAPAEAPVTFVVANGAPLGGWVPAGTQVATTQTEKADAHTFETRRGFHATPARLERILSLLPGADRFIELPTAPVPPEPADLATSLPIRVLTADEPELHQAHHVLYLASEELFGREGSADVAVTLQITDGTFPTVTWSRFDKAADRWVDLSPTRETTPGQVTFTFPALGPVDPVEVDGVEDHWIAARFDGPYGPGSADPLVSGVAGSLVAPPSSTPLEVPGFDAAFFNSVPLDTSKPYQPFGTRPAYGDAFYFASDVAFGEDVDEVTLSFTIRPYEDPDLEDRFDTNPREESVRTVAKWQFLDASGEWVTLATYDHEFTFAATSGAVTRTSHAPSSGAGLGTFIGTSSGDTLATVTLSGFGDIGRHELHGVESRWMRVLLVSEDPYGHDGVRVGSGSTTRFIGPLFIPPAIEDVEITYVPSTSEIPIAAIKTFNGFSFRDPSASPATFRPFHALESELLEGAAVFGDVAALYLAFDRAFSAAFTCLFFDLAGQASSLFFDLETGEPRVVWEYWSGAGGWRKLDVVDDTLDLTTSGTIGFTGPVDAVPAVLFSRLDPLREPDTMPRWWLRARLDEGGYDHPPAVRGVYLNTVAADNRTTTPELLVGSSNGEPDQELVLVKKPVLGGELWVRELEIPGDEELRELEAQHRVDRLASLDAPQPSSVLDVRATQDGGREVWVRWRRTPTLEGSNPRSRHYTLEPVAGVVGFGDGTRGLIPPIGRDNLVMRGVRTGGGERANRESPALAIKELKTSLPFIDSVFNVVGATAGASPWSFEELRIFGPQSLKNRSRPVTTEDYEWMVRQRFSQVARVRCRPTREPDPGGGLRFKAGAVTVLVVPDSATRRPQPEQGLVREIREFLASTALANIGDDIHVTGPDYAAVDIEASLVPTRPELTSVALGRAESALEAFLHPLTGGEDGTGYGFGRPVYLSEVHAVLERIDEVDHVVSASFPGAPGADAFTVGANRLASSGTHTLTV